jgi:chromosomal replication initiation ATPase DnaA
MSGEPSVPLTAPDVVRRVIREAAQAHGVKPAEIVIGGPSRRLVRPRHMVAATLYEMRHPCGKRKFSLPQIGAWLGGRHHTTILHAVRAHEKRMGGNP